MRFFRALALHSYSFFFCFLVHSQDNENTLLEQSIIGGESVFYEMLGNNIGYPSRARYNGIMGLSVLNFKVNCDDEVTDIIFEKRLGHGIEEEVLHQLQILKFDWKPCGDRPQNQPIQIKIAFDLEGSGYSPEEANLVVAGYGIMVKASDRGVVNSVSDKKLIKRLEKALDDNEPKEALTYLKALLMRHPLDKNYQALKGLIYAQLPLIQGRVVDAETNQPISNVNIVVNNAMAEDPTSFNGGFELIGDSLYVTFSHANYASVSAILNSSERKVVVRMAPKVHALNPLEVVDTMRVRPVIFDPGRVFHEKIRLGRVSQNFQSIAEFNYGQEVFNNYILSEAVFNSDSLKEKCDCDIKFTIWPDGSLQVDSVINSPSAMSTRTLTKIFNHSPKWIPAFQNAVAVKTSYIQHLNYEPGFLQTLAIKSQEAICNPEKIFTIADQAPQSLYRVKAINLKLKEGMALTKEQLEMGSNSLFIELVINCKGEVGDYRIVKKVQRGFIMRNQLDGLSPQIARILSEMAWRPATHQGNKVDYKLIAKVSFDEGKFYVTFYDHGAARNTDIGETLQAELEHNFDLVYSDSKPDSAIIIDLYNDQLVTPLGGTFTSPVLNYYGTLSEYVSDHMRYPVYARRRKVEGVVVVLYKIDRNGLGTPISISKGVDPVLDKEAFRVLNDSPPWESARINDSAIEVYAEIPIIFKL